MTMTRTPVILTGFTILVAILLSALFSAASHPEAVNVYAAIDSNIGSGCRDGLYVSLTRGTLLVVVDMGGGQSGGQVIRFFETRFNDLIPADTIYECTAFQACGDYWCRVIHRDGYIKLASVKWIAPMGIFSALTALAAWLRRRGRDELADAVDTP